MEKIAYLDLYGDVGSPKFVEAMGGDPANCIDVTVVDTFIRDNKDADVFKIKLRTRGGNVDDGYTIRENLIASGKRIIIEVIGYVYSIGTVILGAAKKEDTYITSDSEYLAHNPRFSDNTIGGDATDLQNYANEMLKIENKIANTLALDSGIDLVDVKIIMKEAQPISGKEAVEKGLVGNLIDTTSIFPSHYFIDWGKITPILKDTKGRYWFILPQTTTIKLVG